MANIFRKIKKKRYLWCNKKKGWSTNLGINEKISIFYEKITNRFKFNAYAWRNSSCPKGSF